LAREALNGQADQGRVATGVSRPQRRSDASPLRLATDVRAAYARETARVTTPGAPITVRVNRHNPRKPWEIEIPGRDAHVTCKTLDDARRVAHLFVTHRHPCELIVYDAYDRVIQHEHIA
jgi:hypothetical protein